MIGIFDSGLGGLTVMQALIGRLPDYDYLYLGDNARAPYGNKSAAAIFAYTRQAVGFLFARGCKLVILACNTASAEALRRIQQEYLPQAYPDKRVLGVVIPICEAAVASSRFGRIGVIGTRATINSGVYERELLKLRPGLEIYSEPAPLLVPLVEEGWTGKPETNMILKKYLPAAKTETGRLPDPRLYPLSFFKRCDSQDYGKELPRIGYERDSGGKTGGLSCPAH